MKGFDFCVRARLDLIRSIDYEIIVDTDESEDRLELLHKNVKKYGTVFNTVNAGTKLNGILRRR